MKNQDNTRKLKSLIAEFRAINLRNEDILNEIEDIIEATGAAAPNLPQGRERRNAVTQIPSRGQEPASGISIGDRVLIKTKVKQPSVWPKNVFWDKEKAQRGRVVSVSPRQVHVLTDNQVETWRLPHNVVRL
jgi:hypothetical protein